MRIIGKTGGTHLFQELCTKLQTVSSAVAVLYGALVTAQSLYYVYDTMYGGKTPVLATWLMIWVAVVLGRITYVKYPDAGRHWSAGVANLLDVVNTTVILVAIAVQSHADFSFSDFQTGCLIAGAIVFAYYFTTKKALFANFAANALLTVGFFPTIEKLCVSSVNTESVISWSIGWVAALVGLYNPIRQGNRLAKLYAFRAFICVSIVLLLALRLEFRLP